MGHTVRSDRVQHGGGIESGKYDLRRAERQGRQRDRASSVRNGSNHQRHRGGGASIDRLGDRFDHRAPAAVGDDHALGRASRAAGREQTDDIVGTPERIGQVGQGVTIGFGNELVER